MWHSHIVISINTITRFIYKTVINKTYANFFYPVMSAIVKSGWIHLNLVTIPSNHSILLDKKVHPLTLNQILHHPSTHDLSNSHNSPSIHLICAAPPSRKEHPPSQTHVHINTHCRFSKQIQCHTKTERNTTLTPNPQTVSNM